MRPLGAIVLGAYADRHGRRAGLLLTLSLMAVGTLSLALTPGYATIGLIAPLVVLAPRLPPRHPPRCPQEEGGTQPGPRAPAYP